MQINYAKREVSCKLVYYGPGMSGKTTNLEIVHEKVPDRNKGEMTSIATEGDRTLFFDFLPLDLGKVRGLTTKFQLYTVPGQVYYASTRKLVLQGADGVIFVADSQADKMEENLESITDLKKNLDDFGMSLEDIPLVIQWNKRDLPTALSIEQLEEKINTTNAATVEAVAATGEGVLATLKLAASLVLDRLNSKEIRSAQTSSKADEKKEKAKTGKDEYVARVNEDNISKSYFNQYCQAYYRLTSKSDILDDFKKFTRKEKKKLLEALVNHVLLLQDAKKRGIQASKEEMNAQIKDFTKRFVSKEDMDVYLAERRLSVDNLRNEAIKNVIIGKIIRQVIPDVTQRMKITSQEVTDYYDQKKELLGDRPLKDVKRKIVTRLRQKRKRALLNEFFTQLGAQAKIEIFDDKI